MGDKQKTVKIILAAFIVGMLALNILMIVGRFTNGIHVKSKLRVSEVDKLKNEEENSVSEEEQESADALHLSVNDTIEITSSGASGKTTGSESVTSATTGTNGDYIIPDSGTKKLTDAEVSGLSRSDLRLARNEIIARHGRKFTDDVLRSYFEGKSWYKGTISPDKFDKDTSKYLSKIEQENIDLIKKYENK